MKPLRTPAYQTVVKEFTALIFAMKKVLSAIALRGLLCLGLIAPAGCALPANEHSNGRIEVAFSPEAGSEALIVKVIASAHGSIRLAGYSFTSPTVVKALLDAKRRSVDVRVLVDDKGNRGAASRAAMRLIVGGQIPMRVISMYAIHHDKYIVVDGRHTQTGSFNYSQAAAKSNSENVLVVWADSDVAKRYIDHFEDRWQHGVDVEISTTN